MGVSSHSHMNCRPAGTRFKSSFVLCGLQRGLAHGSQTSVTLAFRSWSISCHGLSPTGIAILENVHPIWYGPSCRLRQAPKHVTVVRTALKKIIPFDKNADLSKFCLKALFFIQSCYPHQPDNNMHPKHLWANFPPFLVRIVCGWDAVVNTTALEALSFSHRSNANFVYESMRFASHVANVHSEGWVVRLFSRNSLGPNHRRATYKEEIKFVQYMLVHGCASCMCRFRHEWLRKFGKLTFHLALFVAFAQKTEIGIRCFFQFRHLLHENDRHNVSTRNSKCPAKNSDFRKFSQ